MLKLIGSRLLQMVLIMAVVSLVLFLIFDSDKFKKQIAVVNGHFFSNRRSILITGRRLAAANWELQSRWHEFRDRDWDILGR